MITVALTALVCFAASVVLFAAAKVSFGKTDSKNFKHAIEEGMLDSEDFPAD